MVVVLNINSKTFIMHIVILDILRVYLFQTAQIRLLQVNKIPITIFAKYSNYIDIFLFKFAIKLSKYIDINNYTIKLEKNKQPFYSLIYSLKLIELEILKVYIETNLVNSFIKSFKLLIKVLILFNCKFNRSFCLYINYYSFNSLIIKN